MSCGCHYWSEIGLECRIPKAAAATNATTVQVQRVSNGVLKHASLGWHGRMGARLAAWETELEMSCALIQRGWAETLSNRQRLFLSLYIIRGDRLLQVQQHRSSGELLQFHKIPVNGQHTHILLGSLFYRGIYEDQFRRVTFVMKRPPNQLQCNLACCDQYLVCVCVFVVDEQNTQP